MMTNDEEIAYLKNKIKEIERQLTKLRIKVLYDEMPALKQALITFK